MASRVRQISIKECYEILGLEKGADLQSVKNAYRRLAFELHPDLNPGNVNASRNFQRLNEAYVALSAMLKNAEEARQKQESKKGTSATEDSKESNGGQDRAESGTDKEFNRAKAAYAEQDILRDILNDPFARRVYEDIYSELSRKDQKKDTKTADSGITVEPREETSKAKQKEEKKERIIVKPFNFTPSMGEKSVKEVLKGWLAKQLDEELSLTFPAAVLLPGKKIPLRVQRGFNSKVDEVEITLPRDFVIGKPMRVRGLGKRLGLWQGDLYLTLYGQ